MTLIFVRGAVFLKGTAAAFWRGSRRNWQRPLSHGPVSGLHWPSPSPLWISCTQAACSSEENGPSCPVNLAWDPVRSVRDGICRHDTNNVIVGGKWQIRERRSAPWQVSISAYAMQAMWERKIQCHEGYGRNGFQDVELFKVRDTRPL